MDMKTFLKQSTQDEREALAISVESSVGYFYLIAGGHRRPGTELCKMLVEKEPKLTLHELRPDVWTAPSPDRRKKSVVQQLREIEPLPARQPPKVPA